ncbi:MAG: T9SS type A sorting domain-containing protein [Bacteroidetes bacterium]|nr:T9SS type A sorting domain-containing protein [Bacteroidota bacterium]
MKKVLISVYLISVLLVQNVYSQVKIDTVSLVSLEKTNTQFCFNNTKLMAGKSNTERFLVYSNPDTVFLNTNNEGIRKKIIANTGNNILSATLTLNKDTVWLCWKEGPFIKARYVSDKGKNWSSVITVSTAGNVSSPSIYASSNGKIHFTWHTESNSDTAVYHRVFFKNGFLTSEYRLSNLTGHGLFPSIVAIGDTVLCTWKELPYPSKVWFRKSFNGGLSWDTPPTEPTKSFLTSSKDPNIAYAFDKLTNTHYVYLTYDSQNKIYLQRSTNFGETWSAPEFISNSKKLSQFAHIDCNNKGFVGISYEQRPIGSSLYDDTKKDVGFTYSTNWGNFKSFSVDTFAYTHNGFGSAYSSFNKIDENNFYLVWLSNDTVNNKINIYERLIKLNTTNGSYPLTKIVNAFIYPNPFSTQTVLHTSFILKNATFYIYNSCGQIVKQIKDINGQEILICRNNLNSGLYFYKLVYADNQTETGKFIISEL